MNIPIGILRAIEARVLGHSWPKAAEAAGWSQDDLRRWIREHQSDWYRTLGRARRDARDAACDEAISMLRNQLRKKKPLTVYRAANSLSNKYGSRPGKARREIPRDDPAAFRELFAEIPEEVTTRIDRHIEAAEAEGEEGLVESHRWEQRV